MTDRSYPDALEIIPLEKPPEATIRVPGSKSITNRALVMGALSDPIQGCEIHGALWSEDTEVMITALRELGFSLRIDSEKSRIHVRRGSHESPIPVQKADLFVGNSGTSMRFLTAFVSLGHGVYRLDGVARMRERPMFDLLQALRQLGIEACSERGDGYPPIVVYGGGLNGGKVTISGGISSQFLSGLLMAAPWARQETWIHVEDALVSRPYVDMTVRMMRDFGISVDQQDGDFFIPGNQSYQLHDYVVEQDATAAGYFWTAAAITGGRTTIPGLTASSIQGDLRFAHVLQEMGCFLLKGDRGTIVKGWPLHGIDIDMNDISDCVMTLAAVACFAEGPTTIRNVAHIRHKETDRLSALTNEL